MPAVKFTRAQSIGRETVLTRTLLICGVLAPICYVATVIVAGATYAGYRFADQAVSELFAIGAPTSRLVVPLFTLSSLLIAAFGAGVWRSSRHERSRRLMASMIWANAVDSLVLWNCFPMHMRGVPATFTDTMHGLLAINPFVLVTLVLAVTSSKGWFRLYSAATIVLVLVPAASAFMYVPALQANQPTHGLGLAERAGQYVHQLWHAVFAIVLLRQQRAELDSRRRAL